jgi:hypothetical protein
VRWATCVGDQCLGLSVYWIVLAVVVLFLLSESVCRPCCRRSRGGRGIRGGRGSRSAPKSDLPATTDLDLVPLSPPQVVTVPQSVDMAAPLLTTGVSTSPLSLDAILAAIRDQVRRELDTRIPPVAAASPPSLPSPVVSVPSTGMHMLCVIVIFGRSGLSAVVTPAAPRGGVGAVGHTSHGGGAVVAVVVGALGEFPLSLGNE